jgi:hypothetical protein
MAPRLEAATIEQVGDIWRVCADGICREHQQEWQARVFWHQAVSRFSDQHFACRAQSDKRF